MSERRHWNASMEEALGGQPMRAIQLQRLRRRVDQLFTHAPYFRRRLEMSGGGAGTRRH